jgi:flavin reductase (DIM6/NTAB) family NADH-FMN oxidoreductase RutF
MTIDPAQFRLACGHFATGVAIVTTLDRTGERHGFTANSFTSVSLEPPLVLVCVEKIISSHPPMTETAGFIFNILTDQQEELARRFATPDIDKFEGVETAPGEFGAPRIPNCLAYIAARSLAQHDGGDHTIFIGEATDCEVRKGLPLIFFRGMYGLPGAAAY